MRFRKKPVAIEAFQMTYAHLQNRNIWPEWLQKASRKNVGELGAISAFGDGREYYGLDIHTLEGTLRVSPGDWIIQGVQGELYPCKPDIFAQTYEPVEEAA